MPRIGGAKSLDEGVKKYYNRKLEDKYQHLFLDGVVLKTKTGFGAKKKGQSDGDPYPQRR